MTIQLLSKVPGGSSFALELQQTTEKLLKERQDELLRFTNVTSADSFCQLTFQKKRTDQILEHLDRQRWSWSDKSYLIHTHGHEPLKAGGVLNRENPLTLKIEACVPNTTRKPLPVNIFFQKS